MVTSNFDDDSIKNERASMKTAFFHYKSMGNILDSQGQTKFYTVIDTVTFYMAFLHGNIYNRQGKK